MIKRKLNHRDTWSVKINEEVAGNYYPITTKIDLEDDTARMAILTDRAQGGSSLKDGSLELMVHRRLLKDDAFGVGEALNETEFGDGLIARGKHHLFFGKSTDREGVSLKGIERLTQLEKLLPTWKFFSNMEAYSADEWQTSFTNSVSIKNADITILFKSNQPLITVHRDFIGSAKARTSSYLGTLA